MSIFDAKYSESDDKKPANFTQFKQGGAIPNAISERHVACVFLLDVSGSMMQNDAIGKLNKGMVDFGKHMLNDGRVANVVDTAIVTFGNDVKVVQDWMPVSEMTAPVLTAKGNTPLGKALRKALEMIEDRKKVYKATGTPYYRPWIFCVTDGVPTDDWKDAAKKLKEAEDDKKVIARCVCVENDPNFSRAEIRQIFDPSRILKLEGLDFSGLFEFVSNSLSAVSKSNPSTDKTISVEVPRTLTMDI